MVITPRLALGLALALVAGCAAPAGSPTGSGPVPADRVAAAAPSFAEPAVIGPGQRDGKIVTVDLAAQTATVDLGGGQTAEVLSYNGGFPGPTIDVQEGDRLVVRFKNALAEPTSLHWHGLSVPADQDDATHTVAPGATRTYAFDIPAGAAGTYWYHPHLHGTVAAQVARGLYGALRVRAAADPLPAGVGDTLAILSDMRVQNGRAVGPLAAERANGFEGERVLMNGRSASTLALRPGETRRLRLINAAASRYFRLALPGRSLTLVGTDGGYLEKPVTLPELLLAPGERAEVLVQAPTQAGGTASLVAMPYDRGTMPTATATPQPGAHGGHAPYQVQQVDHSQHGAMAPTAPAPSAGGQPLLGFRAEGEAATPVTLPAALRAIAPMATDGAVTRAITFSEDHEAGTFFINGRVFDHARVDVRAKLGATEVWTVRNTGHMDHPFHLHGFGFQVLDRNGAPEPYRAWKDTVNVKPNEIVRFAVRFDRHPGMRVFHCHILDHEDLGMMGVMTVEP